MRNARAESSSICYLNGPRCKRRAGSQLQAGGGACPYDELQTDLRSLHSQVEMSPLTTNIPQWLRRRCLASMGPLYKPSYHFAAPLPPGRLWRLYWWS